MKLKYPNEHLSVNILFDNFRLVVFSEGKGRLHEFWIRFSLPWYGQWFFIGYGPRIRDYEFYISIFKKTIYSRLYPDYL